MSVSLPSPWFVGGLLVAWAIFTVGGIALGSLAVAVGVDGLRAGAAAAGLLYVALNLALGIIGGWT